MDKSTCTNERCLPQSEVSGSSSSNLVHCEVQCDLQLGQAQHAHHPPEQLSLGHNNSNSSGSSHAIQAASLDAMSDKSSDRHSQPVIEIKHELKPIVTGCKEATRQIARLG